MKLVLSYLWALGHNRLEPVPFQPSVRPSVTKNCSDLHMTFLHIEPEMPPPKDTVTPKEPSLLEKMNSSLETIVENNIMRHTALSSSSSKRKFENRQTNIFQTLLLTASATDSSSIPTEPCHRHENSLSKRMQPKQKPTSTTKYALWKGFQSTFKQD